MPDPFSSIRAAFQQQTRPIRLFWSVLGLLCISFTLESLAEIIIMPGNALRWVLVLIILDGTGLVFFVMSRKDHLRGASIGLVVVLWLLVTGLAVTENGVLSPTIDIAYLITIFVSGLLLNELVGIVTGLISVLSLMGMSIAGMQGYLPRSFIHRSIIGTWVADIFYLAIVIGLQYLAVNAIRKSVNQANKELLERKRVETDLSTANTYKEMHRLLDEQVEKAQLQIARDLHDGPVQELTASLFNIQYLLEENKDPSLEGTLREIQVSLKNQIANLRTLASDLRSPTLVKFGLSKALQEYLDSFREKHPELDITITEMAPDIQVSEEVALTLFRTFSEAMNNIVRHARANKVEIQLTAQDHHVQLVIQDNGIGFLPPKEWVELAKNGHYGLVGMQERVDAVGGKLLVESQVNEGTKLEVSVPLPLGETVEV